MKTILVLGGSGFIGDALCHALVDTYRIICADLVCKSSLQGHDNYSFIPMDFVHTNDFSPLLQGVDIVCHFICTTVPRNGTDQLLGEIEANVMPTLRLLEAMERMKIKDIVFLSSAGTVYGDSKTVNTISSPIAPLCGYGVQKVMIEQYLALYRHYHDFNAKVIRLSNPYGIEQDAEKIQGVIPIFIRRLLNDQSIKVYGDTNRDYVYMDDVILGIVKVIEYQGNEAVFQLCYGQSYKLSHVIKLIEQYAGRTFRSIEYESCRQCDVPDVFLDALTTSKVLGWSAKTSIEEGIALVFECISKETAYSLLNDAM